MCSDAVDMSDWRSLQPQYTAFTAKPGNDIPITERNGRKYTIWERFLLQWACSNGYLYLRHIWEVAQVFLAKRVPLHTTFDVDRADRRDIGSGVEYEAKQLIKERIPSAWLSEVTYLYLLTECGHKRGCKTLNR